MSVDVYGIHGLIDSVQKSFDSTRSVQITGLSSSFSELLVCALRLRTSSAKQPLFDKLVIVLSSPKEFSSWINFLESNEFLGGFNVNILPSSSIWGTDRFVNQSSIKQQRMYALSSLADKSPSITLTTLQGLSQKTLTRKVFNDSSLRLEVNTEYDSDSLIVLLRDLGYIQSVNVEEEGNFAVRGGIIDVFALNHLNPVRIEFWSDEIASIRYFSLDTQKSFENLSELTITPAQEVILKAVDKKQNLQTLHEFLLPLEIEQNDKDGILNNFEKSIKSRSLEILEPVFRDSNSTALEYLSENSLLIFPQTIDACLDKLKDSLSQNEALYTKDVENNRATISPRVYFETLDYVQNTLNQRTNVIELSNPFSDVNKTFIKFGSRLTLEGSPVVSNLSQNIFDDWMFLAEKLISNNATVAILAKHDDQVDRIKNLLNHRNLSYSIDANLLEHISSINATSHVFNNKSIVIGRGYFSQYIWLEENNLLILPEHILFGRQVKNIRPATKKLQNYLSSFKELKAGSLVVHIDHGIGRYCGMTTLQIGGVSSDFLILEYADGDKIYLPIDRLNLLQRYNVGSDTQAHVPLDKLKSQGWQKRKSRVKKAVKDMADELLKLQANRKVSAGISCSPLSEDYFKFEAAFPFEETEDQLKAIEDVNSDLVRSEPMDRLVCGDVGFGKTEVALRAAYRTAMDGFQTLILVPTTILCHQHYRTFSERLTPHGLKVAQVNRFVDSKTTKEAVELLERGQVDVMIGTHRLLSKDIKVKRLGLLVVDEEQRFGVTHKEKIKKFQHGCNVLTMTATPIPRTLHMAMLGLRDISIIATPPQDRMAVKTYVAKFDDVLIKEAVTREIQRGGQVFFVHNRVDDIAEIYNYLQKILPDVSMQIAHGQMHENKLEQVIIDFLDQKFSVLICTTIIEAGIDMPNVNTLIVNKADRFGLSQLYQLKGRVGRSDRQAFAYFLTSPKKQITQDALDRLAILSAYQELGSGFQIASYDLEFRGAGNLLGGEQSGHVTEVGFELYTQMLEAAIHEIRGESAPPKVDTEIKLPISALLPRDYISSESNRLQIYKSLFSVESYEELAEIQKETLDRFGNLPLEAQLLFKIAELKRLLRICGAMSLVKGVKNTVEIRFASLTESQIDKILKAVTNKPRDYKLSPDYKLILPCEVRDGLSLEEQSLLLDGLIALIQPLV